MRHLKNFNHLGRKSAHRKAMLSNMASSLILHKRIKTTVAKAKALRVYVEPLINRTKEDTTHSRRVVFSYLQNKEAVTELFHTVADKVSERPGGYTRILKIGNRIGDNAEMCYIELVDFNENLLKQAETKRTTTRRSRRSGAKKEETPAAKVVEEQPVAEVVEEVVAEPVAEVVAEVVAEEPAEEPQPDTEEAKA